MSQSDARKARRQCKQEGHIPKTGAPGERYCARCGEPL